MADSRSRGRRRGERRGGGHRDVRRAVCGNTVVVVAWISFLEVLDKDCYFETFFPNLPHTGRARCRRPACADGSDGPAHLPALRGPSVDTVRRQVRGRHQRKRESREGVLHRPGVDSGGLASGAHLPRGHQRRVRRVHVVRVLRDPAERDDRQANGRSARGEQSRGSVRPGPRLLGQEGGQHEVAEKGPRREARRAATIDGFARGVAGVPGIDQADHVRGEALFIVQVRGVGEK
mmetsp:Transcript_2488/g.9758  ORF Transcript_2488/g.9758 Transcript_2488/m.9758 type:complete len:234 (+) Transcript_2488:2824-3525(+)